MSMTLLKCYGDKDVSLMSPEQERGYRDRGGWIEIQSFESTCPKGHKVVIPISSVLAKSGTPVKDLKTCVGQEVLFGCDTCHETYYFKVPDPNAKKFSDAVETLSKQVQEKQKKIDDDLALKHSRCLLSLSQAIHEAHGTVNSNLMDMSLNEFLQMISRNEIEFLYVPRGK